MSLRTVAQMSCVIFQKIVTTSTYDSLEAQFKDNFSVNYWFYLQSLILFLIYPALTFNYLLLSMKLSLFELFRGQTFVFLKTSAAHTVIQIQPLERKEFRKFQMKKFKLEFITNHKCWSLFLQGVMKYA